jgi:hypothetical protein
MIEANAGFKATYEHSCLAVLNFWYIASEPTIFMTLNALARLFGMSLCAVGNSVQRGEIMAEDGNCRS